MDPGERTVWQLKFFFLGGGELDILTLNKWKQVK